MKGIFGLVALLVVLAIVALVAKSQLHGTSTVAARERAAAASAAGLSEADRRFGLAASSSAVNAAPLSEGQQIKQMQQQAADAAAKALQDGVERNERADQSAR